MVASFVHFEEIPHLGFGFAAELIGHVSGRMNLDRELVGGIEEFH